DVRNEWHWTFRLWLRVQTGARASCPQTSGQDGRAPRNLDTQSRRSSNAEKFRQAQPSYCTWFVEADTSPLASGQRELDAYLGPAAIINTERSPRGRHAWLVHLPT